MIPDHHPGHLDWASYRRQLSMIESNAYMMPSARKSARGGRSLLAGLLRCRRCGHRLQISYSGRDNAAPNFRCLRRHHQTGSAACVSCSGTIVDERGQVRAQILGEDGGGNIRLRDSTGAVRIKLGASTQGSTGLLVFGICPESCRKAFWRDAPAERLLTLPPYAA